VCDNGNQQEDMANDNYNLENDLVKRLQERKREALQLEAKIDQIRQQKADVLAQVVEAERNVMFWEKKIQIAKETEMALDPTIGKDEINRMKREIYIMEQRLGNLQREQRRKVEEMAKLIDHRDVLRTKGQAIQAASKDGQKGVTKATVSKDNARLATDLSSKKKEAQSKDQQIRECITNTERTGLEVERVQQETEQLRHDLAVVEQSIALKTQERQRTVEEKSRKQVTLQRFRDAESGAYKLAVAPEALENERRALELKKRAVLLAVQEVSERFPVVAPLLRDVAEAL